MKQSSELDVELMEQEVKCEASREEIDNKNEILALSDDNFGNTNAETSSKLNNSDRPVRYLAKDKNAKQRNLCKRKAIDMVDVQLKNSGVSSLSECLKPENDTMGKIKKESDNGTGTLSQPPVDYKKGKGKVTKKEPVKDINICSTSDDNITKPSPGKKIKKKQSAATKEHPKKGPDTKMVPVPDLDFKMKMLKEMGARKEKYIGAHVTISGGIWSAVPNAVKIGARAFGMFLKSQRQWVAKPLQEEDAKAFKKLLQEYNFSPSLVVPHGSYLMNCGSPGEEILEKSRTMLIDELKRCEMLGLEYFNFHPGSTCGKIPAEESISLIAESINLALAQTKYVTAVLESMSCQGNTIGGKFSELAQIIDKVKDKSRVGVCLDTCHMFAAGYDIKSSDGYEQVLKEFDKVVGFNYLKAVHLNDSKGKLGCHRDLHANIGQGEIGLATFRRLMNDPRFDNIPMLLETPDDDDTKWIKLLNSLMD